MVKKKTTKRVVHHKPHSVDMHTKMHQWMVWLLVILVIVQVLTAFQIVGMKNEVKELNGFFENLAAGQQGAAAQQKPAAAPSKVTVSADDDPVKGDANAKIEIIEFSDYQCPFCERFYSQTLPQLEEKYIKTGKAKLVFRDYPLGFHPEALPAAIAAECAGDQGKYWEYHNKLFENQRALSAANYVVWAEELGLDKDAFVTCQNDPAMKAEAQKDMADGQKVGIRGTPAFVINGQLISGAQPFSVFEQVIEAELNK